MEKGKETQDRMEEELDLFASWDEEEEEEAWRYERPDPYLFIESPPWEGELGANYLYYLGIRPICQGFLPLARMLDACHRDGLPYNLQTVMDQVAQEIGYRSSRFMRKDMQEALRRGVAYEGGVRIWEVMGREWARCPAVEDFLCAAAMDLRSRLAAYAASRSLSRNL